MSEQVGRTDRSTSDEPRCSACGQPLMTWADPHSIEDCRAWLRMSDSDRVHMIEGVMEERDG